MVTWSLKRRSSCSHCGLRHTEWIIL